jgi:hypothetical protein
VGYTLYFFIFRTHLFSVSFGHSYGFVVRTHVKQYFSVYNAFIVIVWDHQQGHSMVNY